MTQLEQLIQDLCPNGVKMVKLGDVVDVLRGKRLTKSELSEDAQYNVYHGGLEPLGKYHLANREADTVMVINVGASAGTVGYSDMPFWSSDGCFCLSHSNEVNNKYLYYYLQTETNTLVSRVRRAGIPTLDSNSVLSLQITLPPLAVQSEIVRLLDKFTLYKSELAAELAARLQQYEYYRDQLLTFDDTVKRVKLGEVFDTRNGYTPSKNNSGYWENGTIPWFRMEDIRANGRILYDSIQHVTPAAVKKIFPRNSIILATSATIGEHALIKVDFLSNQRFTCCTLKEKYRDLLDIKFLFYYFFIIDEWCKSHIKLGNFSSVDMDALYSYPIPIPPLSEQERIVSILDRFDKLCHDIREGLPAEIDLRQKQYEHYRDKLLTFEAKG